MTHMQLISGIDWWWFKRLVVKNDWKYSEEFSSGWRNSTWHWSMDEGWDAYRTARCLYNKGRWKT